MLLELTVVSYHRLSPRQTPVKCFDQQGGTIGRAETSDWHLPDPERVVSGSHARIDKRGSDFYITDLSTNGLFLNRSVDAVGIDNTQPLSDGDFLTLGEYEIEVRLVERSSEKPNVQPVKETVASSDLNSSASKSSLDSGMSMGIAMPNLNDAPIATSSISSGVESVQSVDAASVSNTLDDHFLPPTPNIPEEWDSQWGGNESLVVDTPELVTPELAVDAPKPVTPTVSPSSSNASSSVSSKPNVSNADMAAFLRGLGVSSQMIPAEASDQWWEQLGVAFQELLMGLMGVLRTRSTVKSEFRVNQTTFQQKENNPLKFSATVDDVFHNLFNRSGASFLPARQAIKDAFDDVNRHEEAIMAGAKGSILGVLKQLSPEMIETKDFTPSFMDKMTPARRQARYWDLYKELYKDVQSEASMNNQRAVNEEFTAAYEESLNS